MLMPELEWVGWVATALFVTSYFLNSRSLRLVQSAAALLWIVYGLNISSFPVITANTLILIVAMGSWFRKTVSS